MNYELNKNNNSKKLIIGISILFCTVILIIGATTAFFTQSDSEETGDIGTANINGTLLYNDDFEAIYYEGPFDNGIGWYDESITTRYP